MSYKLYADDRCVEEIAENPREEIQKKPYNCPNCGAPISSYICEYCGTEFEKPKKKMSDEKMRESFAEFARKQKQAELQASQEWQTQNLLNALNIYGVNTQIMNMRDSINTSMTLQNCSLRDQMYDASMLTNVYPANHDAEQKEKPLHIESVNQEADVLAHGINVLCVSLVLFLILVLIVVAYHFLK